MIHVNHLFDVDFVMMTLCCSDEVECQQWMEAINLAAACFSAPALPGGVGSQVTFTRPLLPTAPTKLSLVCAVAFINNVIVFFATVSY